MRYPLLFPIILAFAFCLASCDYTAEKERTIVLQQKDSITLWLEQAGDTVSPIKEKLLEKAYAAASRLPEDTVKAKHFVKLSYIYFETADTTVFRNINNEAIALTKKLKDTSGLADVYWDLGDYLSDRLYKKDSGYYYYAEAQKLYEKTGDTFSSARMYISMAIEQIEIKDYIGSEINSVNAINLLKPLKKYKQLHSCYNNLGITSNDLGKYDKAIDNHNEALNYLRKTDSRNILEPITLNNMGLVYTNQGNYEKAIEKYKEAQRKNELNAQDVKFKATIINNIAYAKFKMGDSTELSKMFYEALRIRDSLNDITGIVNSKLRLGEYYAAYGDTLRALHYGNEARELAVSSRNSGYLMASLLLLSELEKGQKSIAYLNQYVRLSDSLLIAERNLRDKFARIRFETDQLIQEKVQLTKAKGMFRVFVIFLVVLVVLISGVTVYYYRMQQLYRSRFKALLEEKDPAASKQKGVKAKSEKELNISETALHHIREQLALFVSRKAYLSNEVSLNSWAKAMESNPKYLSKVINHDTGKSFINYIKDLRIEHTISELKGNSTFRKYAIKAIAREIGFNTSEAFSKAFYRRTGIYPSYFIRALEQEILRNERRPESAE